MEGGLTTLILDAMRSLQPDIQPWPTTCTNGAPFILHENS